jgi:hypothetical protein
VYSSLLGYLWLSSGHDAAAMMNGGLLAGFFMRPM